VSTYPPSLPSLALPRRAATAAFALAAIAACSNGAAPPGTAPGTPLGTPTEPPSTAAGRTAVLAPIETAELIVRESQPPQYSVRIVSGLPSGCAKFERLDVVRDGYVVNVSVWNSMPSPDVGVACTMIYGTIEHTADLGSAFARGDAIAVHINGESRLSFTPQ
jgi:hypothetical protein